MRLVVQIIVASLLVLLPMGADSAVSSDGEFDRADRKQVSFIPQWTAQAQFAGYYVAHEKGFYAKAGLEVNILPGGPDRSSAVWLERESADFGTLFLSTGIRERARGVRLVNIGQVVRRSSQLLLAKRSSGIRTWEDMNGRKVGLWGAELSILPTALFRKHGLQITIIPQTFTVNLFLRDGVDVASAMWYNEYHTVLSSGVDPEELVVFRLADEAMNFPEDGIYCLEKTWRKDPEMCCRFVRASLEGWRYAFEHEEEAINIIMKVVNDAKVATNRAHQKWMLHCMRDIIDPSGTGENMAVLLEEDYNAVARELQANGLIDETPAFSDFSANCAGTHEK